MKKILFLLILFPFIVQADLVYTDFKAYKQSPFSRPECDSLVEAGFKNYSEARYDQAMTDFRNSRKCGVESPLVLTAMALLHEYKKNLYSALDLYPRVKEDLKRFHADHRFYKDFNENYGRALFTAGQYDLALDYLEEALKTTTNAGLPLMLAQLANEAGDSENATRYLEHAQKLAQNNNDTTHQEQSLIELARIKLAMGQKDLALQYYRQLLTLNPQQAEAKEYISKIEKSYREDQMLKLFDEIKDF